MSGTSAARAFRLRPALGVRRVRAGLGLAAHFAFWLWLSDVVRLIHPLPSPLAPWVSGLACALFRAFAISLGPGLVLGLWLWLYELRRYQQQLPPLRLRVIAYLRAGSPEAQSVRAGGLIAAGPLIAAWAWAAVRLCETWIVGMARPKFIALACVASCAVLLLMAAVSWPALAALGALFHRRLAGLPRVGPRLFGSAWHVAVWIALGLVAALCSVVYRFREPLGYLPWPTILQVAGALVLAGLTAWLGTRLPPRTRPYRFGVGVALVLGSLVAAYVQSPLAVFSRQISERETLSGRLGQRALLALWDRDRDGYLPGFGGGDCAPRDRLRNPGALDVPGNGLDEDCDGSDLDPKASALRGKYDYAVPYEVPARPPIVLITVDAFAARHMHALGYARGITPQIDAFAQRSVFFRQCYAQGPSTRLSFPSIFASRWDTQIVQELVGHHPFPISPRERLLAEVLKDAGYDTTAVLSDGYFSPRFWRGITRGFSHIIETPYTADPPLPHDGPRVTEVALAELKRARDKPAFLWVHYYDAHSPHQQPADIPVLGRARKDVYDAELSLVDREVGRLLAAIEEQWAGKALVVLTADHGIAFDEPRHATFNYGYDLHTTVLHVPLIIHAPFLSPRALDGVVSTMDIAPTLANLLRLKERLPYEGMSLLPELLTGKTSRPPELMHQMFIEERKWKQEEPLERVALRTERFNLLQDRKTGLFELYDYRADYEETKNLALDPFYGATLAALRKQLYGLLYSAQDKPATLPAKTVSQHQTQAAP